MPKRIPPFLFGAASKRRITPSANPPYELIKIEMNKFVLQAIPDEVLACYVAAATNIEL